MTGHITHSVTLWLLPLSSLARLLPLSKAIVAYRTVLLASYWKKTGKKKKKKKEKKRHTRTRKTAHITPLFQYFHWLPIQQRIQYKINSLCYNCITGTAPSYLCDCLQLYTPSRTLRSASDTLNLQIPCTRLSTVGSRAFSVFGPSTWNDLPLHLRQKPSLDSFKLNLKTFLFPKL